MLADYDIETAEVLIAAQRWVYVAYLCEQAVERLLKGMYVYYCGREAPKSHNPGYLLSRLRRNEFFCSHVDIPKFDAQFEKQEDFLSDLMFYYISDYPFSYQKLMDRFINEQTAMELYNGTLQMLRWLKSLQKPVRVRMSG